MAGLAAGGQILGGSGGGFLSFHDEKARRKGPTILIMFIAVMAVTGGDLIMSYVMKRMGPLQILHLGPWWRGESRFGEVWNELCNLIWIVFSQPLVWLAIALMLTFLVLWMIALSWSDLTFVMPLTAMTYVINAVLVGPVLHEQLSPFRWLGTLLIAFGVALVSADVDKSAE